jgi:hypothetical protein
LLTYTGLEYGLAKPAVENGQPENTCQARMLLNIMDVLVKGK